VVNPAAPTGRVRLALTPRVMVGRPAPEGRVARAKEPLARVRDTSSRAWVRRHRDLSLEVTSVRTGVTETLLAPLRPDGTCLVDLDAADGPQLVRPRFLRGAGAASGAQDWYAWVDAAETVAGSRTAD
jgi:hypothetical protein